MAQEPYLLDPETLDIVPLYDPRYKRRRHRYSYDPMPRRRRSRARSRRRYDPQFRRMISRARPGRRAKGIATKLNKHLGKLGLGLGALTFLWTAGGADYTVFAKGNPTAPIGNKLQIFLASVWTRVTGRGDLNPVNWYPATGFNPTVHWSLTKAFNTPFWLGLAATIYGHLPFSLPLKSAARKVGGPVAVASFIGGGFDPTPTTTATGPATRGSTYSTVTATTAAAPRGGLGY